MQRPSPHPGVLFGLLQLSRMGVVIQIFASSSPGNAFFQRKNVGPDKKSFGTIRDGRKIKVIVNHIL